MTSIAPRQEVPSWVESDGVEVWLRKCSRVWLQTEGDDPVGARRFYEQLGFRLAVERLRFRKPVSPRHPEALSPLLSNAEAGPSGLEKSVGRGSRLGYRPAL
jgi:hypothetical protein